MADPGRSPSGHPDVHHEEKDINVRAVLWVIVITVVFAIVVHVGLWLLMRALDRNERSRDPQRLSAIPVESERLPPEPRLQISPVTEMREFRRAEEQKLHSYGWVDREQGIVHIPIETAIEKVLTSGALVARPSGADESELTGATLEAAPEAADADGEGRTAVSAEERP